MADVRVRKPFIRREGDAQPGTVISAGGVSSDGASAGDASAADASPIERAASVGASPAVASPAGGSAATSPTARAASAASASASPAGMGGLMTETQVIERPDEKGWEKVSTRIKKAFMAKIPQFMRNPSNLVVRTLTGAVYITLTVVCIWASDVTTALYLALLCAICANEFYYMLRSDAKLPNEFLGVCAAALFPLSAWLFGLAGIAVVFVAFVLVLLVWYVFWPPARISDVAISLFGAVYTGVIMSTVMALRMSLPEPWGAVLVLVLFASVWGNDAVAYLVGSAIGKHKLAPHISPKKSWEGFIAGLIFAMVCWCGIAQIPGVVMPIPMALCFGFINGLSGVLGDLVESRIKRNSGFKDSGTIMPGHGGLLDRCDSQFLVTLTGTIMLVLGGCIPYVF